MSKLYFSFAFQQIAFLPIRVSLTPFKRALIEIEFPLFPRSLTERKRGGERTSPDNTSQRRRIGLGQFFYIKRQPNPRFSLTSHVVQHTPTYLLSVSASCCKVSASIKYSEVLANRDLICSLAMQDIVYHQLTIPEEIAFANDADISNKLHHSLGWDKAQ